MKTMKFKLNYNHLDCLLKYVERLIERKINDNDDLLIGFVLTAFYCKMRAKYLMRYDGVKPINMPMEVAVCLLKLNWIEQYTDYEMGVIVPMVTDIDKYMKQLLMSC